MFRLILGCTLCFALVTIGLASAASNDALVVKQVTIHADRDIGFFVGDLVKARVDIVVAPGYHFEPASLPHPGPIQYWLDLRSIELKSREMTRGDQRFSLALVYQDFYDALDTHPQEIPGFDLTFSRDGRRVQTFVPPWNIEVSALREVAPPVESDPKNYLRADRAAAFVDTTKAGWALSASLVATLLSLVALAWQRGLWPFHHCPNRIFNQVLWRLKRLQGTPVDAAYEQALLLVHRGIDRTDGRRVFAEDLDGFLRRHARFEGARLGLAAFFETSRAIFFANPAKSKRPDASRFEELTSLVRQLACAERAGP